MWSENQIHLATLSTNSLQHDVDGATREMLLADETASAATLTHVRVVAQTPTRTSAPRTVGKCHGSGEPTPPNSRRFCWFDEERLSDKASQRLASLLALGDPDAEVAVAYRVKERLREFYRCPDGDTARAMLEELIEHCRRRTMPPELQKLARTLRRWIDKICNYHLARISKRTHRSAQQPDQTDQTNRVRLPQLQQLPDPRTPLRRQTQLARPRLHRGPVTSRPRQNPKSHETGLVQPDRDRPGQPFTVRRE